jgi:hypothetical protein
MPKVQQPAQEHKAFDINTRNAADHSQYMHGRLKHL